MVVFGAGVLAGGRPSRTLRARVEAAFQCGGPAARYIVSGAVGRHPPAEAQVMAGLLESFGVPPAQIVLDEASTDTLSSALAMARLLKAESGPVRCATSGYHMPRCLMLLRMTGVRATACNPPPRPHYAWYWRLREAAALPYDAVMMAMRRRSR